MRGSPSSYLALIVVAASVVCIASCATQKEWTATGGSRADGTVDLSYQYGELQAPQEDTEQGVTLASTTCAEWGYSGAQAFGGQTKQCSQLGGLSGCLLWTVTRKYQCTGAPSTGPVAVPATVHR
jgi:hypothetical protein